MFTRFFNSNELLSMSVLPSYEPMEVADIFTVDLAESGDLSTQARGLTCRRSIKSLYFIFVLTTFIIKNRTKYFGCQCLYILYNIKAIKNTGSLLALL